MTPSRWREISAVYNAAAARAGTDRIAYLSHVCGSDEELRKEVDALLARGESFLANPIALPTGSRLGPFELLSVLGAGGMGVVYRAHDLKLHRDVALKVLPEAVALDPDRIARFRREATVLASLNHSNIGAIYGLEDSGDVHALVLELVDGPTLADRIAQGPIPLDEALPIARQIAEALDAAHEQGIIHRDLKPANIKLRPDGTVKVLDFGLAKITKSTCVNPSPLSLSPTITSPAVMTGVGVLLGTAAYMAPEQAKGRPADKRSDIWAFGCVLFEMLTGRRAFDGEDVSETLATVLKGEPDWTLFPADVPAVVRALVQKCLNKARAHRLADISTVLFVLDGSIDLASPGVSGVVRADARSPARHHAALLLLALILGSVLTGAVAWFTARPSAPHLSRLMVTPAPISALTVSGNNRDLAIAPDGTHIVYVGASGTQMFVRAMDRLEPTPLTGLGLPVDPFFSPDGNWIGFANANVDLRKVGVTGGPPVTLCLLDGAQSRGATWAEDGSIVFATSGPTGLRKCSPDGGTSTALTTPNRERGEADHLWPEFLPGGQAVLFTITQAAGGTDDAQVAVLDLRTGTQKILIRGGTHAHYVQSGHLV
jgi:serine/threonine-protein kinase